MVHALWERRRNKDYERSGDHKKKKMTWPFAMKKWEFW